MTPIQIKEWLKDKERYPFIRVKKLDTLDYINSLESRNNELALALIGVMRIVDEWIDDKGYNLSDDPHCYLAIGRAAKASKAARDAIEAAKERADLMMIQMQGDCGVCKHRHTAQFNGQTLKINERCEKCLSDTKRPMWEYEGLPEVKKR